MSEQFVGEIRLFAGPFAPVNWALCYGQELQISEYEALFTLIGTTYGGTGTTTFKLPDLRGRLPVGFGTCQGQTYQVGYWGGVETVTLTKDQIPPHVHALNVLNATADQTTPSNTSYYAAPPGQSGGVDGLYLLGSATSVSSATMAGNVLVPAGGTLPHDNIMPSMAINYIIALIGVYPDKP